MTENFSPGGFTSAPQSRIDILGIDQTETEMSDPSGTASLSRSLLKNEHIPRAGRLRLNKAVLLVYRNDAEYFLIKSQRALGITNRKSDVCQTVCSDCGCTCFHGPNETKVSWRARARAWQRIDGLNSCEAE